MKPRAAGNVIIKLAIENEIIMNLLAVESPLEGVITIFIASALPHVRSDRERMNVALVVVAVYTNGILKTVK